MLRLTRMEGEQSMDGRSCLAGRVSLAGNGPANRESETSASNPLRLSQLTLRAKEFRVRPNGWNLGRQRM
jgi:hypothetical protein